MRILFKKFCIAILFIDGIENMYITGMDLQSRAHKRMKEKNELRRKKKEVPCSSMLPGFS